jgi:ADP-ribose pyrophosphatase YjhB (NUDIX family)
MTSGWLDVSEWRRIQTVVPILCVDALAVRRGVALEAGLILRETPHQGRRWCLLGGRVRRGEVLADALRREWHQALGPDYMMGPVDGPTVVEYQPDALPGRPHDPRQHSVSMTYTVIATEEPRTLGREALDFRWFTVDQVNSEIVGFGQESVVTRSLTHMRA